MRDVKLYYLNGLIADYFELESEERIEAEFPEKVQKKITRSVLTAPEMAVAYAKRVHEIKSEVKAEIEAKLGFEVDVGFDPEALSESLPERVDELNEALTMILEGVTE